MRITFLNTLLVAALGKVVNGCFSLAQDTGKLFGLQGGSRLARAGVKSYAMLAALALSFVLIGAGRAAAQPHAKTTAEPQAKTKAEERTNTGVKQPPIALKQL